MTPPARGAGPGRALAAAAGLALAAGAALAAAPAAAALAEAGPAAAGAGPGLPWPAVAGLAVLAALLSLDDTAFAQTWLSQPLPTGILAGALCGDPATGLAVGLPFQLITMGNLPVGQTFTGEKVGAVIAAVGATVLTGNRLAPLGQAAPAEAAGLLGWVLTAATLFSLAGNGVVQIERRTHFLWMLEGHRSLWDGRLGRLERLQARCLAATALRGVVLSLGWLIFMVGLWLPLYAHLPARAVRALALLPLLVPPLAVAALVDLYGLRAAWKWIGGSLAAAVSLAIWLD